MGVLGALAKRMAAVAAEKAPVAERQALKTGDLLGGLGAVKEASLPAVIPTGQLTSLRKSPLTDLAQAPVSRRTVLKQAAATAARNALPSMLESAVVKQAIQPAVTAIPDASIQAAISSAMDKVFSNKSLLRLTDEAGMGLDELMPMLKEVVTQDVPDWSEVVGLTGLGKPSLMSIHKAHQSLSPEAIANAYKLPVEDVNAYLKKVNGDPQQALVEWMEEPHIHDAFFDDRGYDQVDGYGHGNTMADLMPEIEKLKASGLPSDELHEQVTSLYNDLYLKNSSKYYRGLLGDEGYSKLVGKHGDIFGNPEAMAQDRLDYLWEGDDLLETLQNYTSAP